MFVSIKEFARITGIGSDFIRGLCRSPEFPVLMVGKKYMIDSDAAIHFLKDKAAYREYVKVRNTGKKAV